MSFLITCIIALFFIFTSIIVYPIVGSLLSIWIIGSFCLFVYKITVSDYQLSKEKKYSWQYFLLLPMFVWMWIFEKFAQYIP